MNTILLDIDDTLYPKGKGPFRHVSERIDAYVMDVCSLDLDEARRLRKGYIKEYGSTLQGLMQHYGIDPGHFLDDVHNVPVEEILCRDERLHETLVSLDFRLVGFTNGSFEYASRVLRVLGIDDMLKDLFTIEYMDFVPKPLPWAYYKVIQQYGGHSKDFLVVDDSIPNIRTALNVGMSAILVGSDSKDDACLSVADIYSIQQLIYNEFKLENRSEHLI